MISADSQRCLRQQGGAYVFQVSLKSQPTRFKESIVYVEDLMAWREYEQPREVRSFRDFNVTMRA